ncbi:hypothetical protein BEN71_14720 [Acinetobacter wuhouensis]|uniref:outer membrane protein assembly factor BamB family protein n=1 Tax=Acinetobacter wuhouensis TaxID=1879050 RepID=UPI00083B2166|nr:PQQ-binding-like beta-propeller repeat protein [Acinetobacter wuhouensis]AXQ23254.1 hypothetical protein BEN71_14720 [Acinetobacter wuhouensis]
MKRNWSDLISIYGNIQGAREGFEEVCRRIIKELYPNENVKRVELNQGDAGIDIFVGNILSEIIIFQCKFHLNQLGDSQKSQIRESFKRIIENKDINCGEWVLCLPKNLTLEEHFWWQKWTETQIIKFNLKKDFFKLLDGEDLINYLKKFDLYDDIFQIKELLIAKETNNIVKETNNLISQKVAFFDPYHSRLPKVIWSRYIGIQTRKNTPLINGHKIYIGSAGSEWNKADKYDGAYCLDIDTGQIIWFFATNSDVNEIALLDGFIYFGCDNGYLYCLSSLEGKLIWKLKLDSGVITTIIKHMRSHDYYLLVITYQGNMYWLDPINGDVFDKVQTKETIMGDIKTFGLTHDQNIIIPTTSGQLLIYGENNFQFQLLKRIQLKYPDEYSKTGYSIPEIYSKPLLHENFLYISYSRETYYSYPPICKVNLDTGNIIWHSSPIDNSHHYGNIRTNLLLYKNEVIFTHPYSNELGGVDSSSGKNTWILPIGKSMFQQWSSPIIHQSFCYLARHDGYLYKINLENHTKEWGLFLGSHQCHGVVYDKFQEQTNEFEATEWENRVGFSIYSTPKLVNNKIIIGTGEGYLYCIENI